MMHPYWDKNFFEFFQVFIARVWLFSTGKLCFHQLVNDEIQLLILLVMGISTAILGSLIVSRKMSMLANSLSHTVLLGIVLSYLLMVSISLKQDVLFVKLNFTVLFVASCLTALLTTFLSNWLHRYCRLQEDASVGFVFTTLFALGLTLLTLFLKDNHIGIDAIMGNIDTVIASDLNALFSIMILNFCIIMFFFKGMKLTTFDPIFARSIGVSAGLMSYLLMFLTSITSIFAFKVVGVFLFLGFLVAPVLAAKTIARSLRELMILACCFAVFSSFVSVAFTRHCLTCYGIGISSAAITTTCLSLCFPLMLIIKSIKTRIEQLNGRFEKKPHSKVEVISLPGKG